MSASCGSALPPGKLTSPRVVAVPVGPLDEHDPRRRRRRPGRAGRARPRARPVGRRPAWPRGRQVRCRRATTGIRRPARLGQRVRESTPGASTTCVEAHAAGLVDQLAVVARCAASGGRSSAERWRPRPPPASPPVGPRASGRRASAAVARRPSRPRSRTRACPTEVGVGRDPVARLELAGRRGPGRAGSPRAAGSSA